MQDGLMKQDHEELKEVQGEEKETFLENRHYLMNHVYEYLS